MSEQKFAFRAGVYSALGITLVSVASFAADSGDAKPVQGIVVSACLDAVSRDQTLDPGVCPRFLIESLQAATQACREAGGKLAAVPEQAVWGLDANHDGQQELMFALERNVTCEDAPAVFSCGSVGCPVALQQLQNGVWREIGRIDTRTAASVSVLESSGGQYGTLRIGCSTTECAEIAYYLWTGDSYEKSYLEVRGARVNVADSMHGLHVLVAYTRLLTVPEAGASFVARYPADSEVAIIGTAANGQYYYVSPCSTCEGGFVEKSAVRSQTPPGKP